MGLFAFVQARVWSVIVAAVVVLVAAVVVLVVPCSVPPATPPVEPPVDQPSDEPIEQPPDEPSTEELLDRYDAKALTVMNGEQLSDRELEHRLVGDDIEARVEVYRLRENERLIYWESPPPKIHGGGARASVFAREGAQWHAVGHVDTAAWTSFVWMQGIDADQGVAYMLEYYDGNGSPPSRIVALGVVDGSLATVEVDNVPTVEVDDDAGPNPFVKLWRRVDDLNPYPDAPIRSSRWHVRRGPNGLVGSESPLTPWVDALEAFCLDPKSSDATSGARRTVERCHGPVALRWASSRRLIVTLELTLRCHEDYAEDVHDAELTIELEHGHWRVVAAPACP